MALAEAQPITLILTTYTIVLLLVVFAVMAILSARGCPSSIARSGCSRPSA